MSRFSFSHVFWIRILSVIEFPKVTFLDLFSCGQLNRWHCHSLTDWVIESVSHFLILEHMTYHWMSESYQGDFLWQFWTILKNVDNFWQFWQCWQFLTIFNNFQQCWQFLQLLTILDNFWQFWQLKRQFWRLVTFETLITVLTIENLNSWQSLLPDN